ncbi:MAG: NADH:ubiquinone reductase (Na(+)-transporting) subunit F [Gemmatimonadota bacterium]|nr:NADH:ubiquinone reductase (Na(+)-transporting) subunit F [Gemmatimonadota bacterium]MDH3422639.1 NADH:ubiquinone reductase (Na(+)-transporting) subunit F [Gemmatimonadota bacterium]
MSVSTIFAAVGAFTSVVLFLVGVLLIARKLLVPSGPVSIVINGGGEQDIRGLSGDTLLSLFTEARVYLPAACGGQGTCGACRVRIEKGAGRLLPTEAVHISRGEAREGWRLACQIKVKGDLSVELPPDVFAVGRWRCTVRSAHNVATFIREIVLDLPEGAAMDFRAGGYIQVECPPYRAQFSDFAVEEQYRTDWERFGLLELESLSTESVTRAYSMANAPTETGVVMLNVRIATPPAESKHVAPGVASSYLFSLRPGDEVNVTGPFGDFFAKESDAEMVFVGGGAGMAPMRSHILDQLERLHTRRRISFWYGARSVRETFYADLFTRLAAEHENFEWYLALSDPAPADRWDGDTGFIHQVLYANHLRDHPAPEDIEYYLCGPPVMIAACRKMLDDLGVEPADILFDDFGS